MKLIIAVLISMLTCCTARAQTPVFGVGGTPCAVFVAHDLSAPDGDAVRIAVSSWAGGYITARNSEVSHVLKDAFLKPDTFPGRTITTLITAECLKADAGARIIDVMDSVMTSAVLGVKYE